MGSRFAVGATIGIAAAIVSTSVLGAQRSAAAPRKNAGVPAILPWARVPLCLEATAAQDSEKSTGPIKWASTRRDVRTARGVVGIQPQSDLIVLTLGGQPVGLGSDVEGKPVTLSDWSIKVWGVPDCAAPSFLFIAQKSDGNPLRERQWFFDPGRDWPAGQPPVIHFPDTYNADTVLTSRGDVLAMTSGAADGNDRTFEYRPDPVRAFVLKGAQEKYLPAIGKANDRFYENAAASDVVRRSAGEEVFTALRARSSAGTTQLFEGRYLIVAGSEPGDFARHAATVVDVVKDVAFFVVCEDDQVETGALVAASRADPRSLERGGDDALAVFRSAGFSLIWSGQRLACDGECHDER